MSESDRYQRLTATAEHRKSPAQIGWQQGYEAGWTDAADRWMSLPQHNDFGPSAVLAALRDQLDLVTLDGITLTARFSTVLADLADAIRHADDDTTTWNAA